MDLTIEHGAVRRHAGLLDLSDHGVVRMTGKDAPAVLNGVLTNDTRLEVGRGCFAILLNDKGRIRTALHVLRTEDALLMLVAPGQGEATRDAIDYYIFTEDAQVEDVSAEWGILSVQGPESASVLGVGDLPELSHVVIRIAGVDVRVVRHSRTGEDGFDLWMPRASLEAVRTSLGLPAVSRETLDVLRVEAGIPWLGPEMSEDFNPLETGVLTALDYEKGCYLGQEVIARITFLSRPVKRLVAIWTEPATSLAPGDPLTLGEKEVGKVTSVVESRTLGRPIAIGYVKNEVIRQNPVLTVRGVEATVRELPLYRAAGLPYIPVDAVRPPMAEGHKPALPF